MPTRIYVRVPLARHVGLVWSHRLARRRPTRAGCGCLPWALVGAVLLILAAGAGR